MALVSDSCICLRKVEFSETSQVLTLLSRRHGIVKALAKGAHRRTRAGAGRFDGGIDLLDLGEAVFTEDPKAELATLAEWKLVDGHLELRRSLRSLNLGLYAAELINLLIEIRDPHPELFDQLARTLPELASDRVEESMLAWELDLLTRSGYLPEFFNCVECGRSADAQTIYFSASRGGLVCGSCLERLDKKDNRVRLDPRLLRLIQSILRLPRANGVPQRLPRLTRIQTDPIHRILAQHIAFHSGSRLKMWDYLLSDGQLLCPPLKS